jgi:hypothetical protein
MKKCSNANNFIRATIHRLKVINSYLSEFSLKLTLSNQSHETNKINGKEIDFHQVSKNITNN